MNFLIPLVSTLLLVYSSSAEELNIRNNCGRPIYVKSAGVNSGPFSLGNGQSRSVSINRGSSARVWAQLGCDGGGNNCETTEGYLSLAEMHWDSNGMTWYDVSMVDGYNLPTKMEPYNPGAGGNCRSASCNFDINRNCPGGNKINKNGRAVACKNPNRDAPTDYSNAIKQHCPGVYSWSKDDNDGMRACNPGNNGIRITFC